MPVSRPVRSKVVPTGTVKALMIIVVHVFAVVTSEIELIVPVCSASPEIRL